MNLDTPSLLIQQDTMERNLMSMVGFAQSQHIALRPHIKTHKSVQIAKRQVEEGAVGVTVAKLDEAEVMVDGGIEDIFIAYPITKKQKVNRLKELTKQANIIASVDSEIGAKALSDTFENEVLEVWIKVNSGLNRCGVEPGEETVNLAKYITALPGLELTGLYTHAGYSYGAKSNDERKRIANYEAESVVKSAQACEVEGIRIRHRSVGATPTFMEAGKVSGVTEVRPGNAIFYDMVQVGLGVAQPEDCALTVLATVVAKHSDRIVIDAGSKSLSFEKGAHGNESVVGFGQVIGYPNLVIERLSEEHGVIPIDEQCELEVNDTVEIIPNHACVVANLFDEYVVCNSYKTVGQWAIDARGGLK
ncbi:alanine racemase [Alkalibacillus haloalkaliphilus]|uniref:alanine racemase n=1 Tax=Alkalibacillus haloalkaliphilus TaxID=94136 RepID=UPI0003047351|nr:alanine racemase [Alkalibacillus haloalkaliphilus]